MLDSHGVPFQYRDYRREPLSEREVRDVLTALGLPASAVLRRRDRAYRELHLTGEEPEDELIERLAAFPTLLARPIGMWGDRAVIGRPPERLLELVPD